MLIKYAWFNRYVGVNVMTDVVFLRGNAEQDCGVQRRRLLSRLSNVGTVTSNIDRRWNTDKDTQEIYLPEAILLHSH